MPPALPPDDRVLAARRAIGENIREARKAARLTQEALAHQAGLSRHGLNRIEQGHSATQVDSLVRIADVLRIPLADLMRE